MDALTNITTIDDLRTALLTDPDDGNGNLDTKIAWLLGPKEHPDYEIVTHIQNEKTYRLYYVVYTDDNGNVHCRFSHMQVVA